MSLKIHAVHNHGDAEQEYIFLEATSDIDLGNYAVVDRTFNKDGKLSNVHRHYFRFPNKSIKNGDFVSLRTSVGKYELDKTNKGNPLHRFYWGSKAPIWNDANTEQAELLKVSTVEYKNAPKAETAKA